MRRLGFLTATALVSMSGAAFAATAQQTPGNQAPPTGNVQAGQTGTPEGNGNVNGTGNGQSANGGRATGQQATRAGRVGTVPGAAAKPFFPPLGGLLGLTGIVAGTTVAITRTNNDASPE